VSAAAEERLALVAEVRESIELVHTAEYPNFLRAFFPPFLRLLRESAPSFTDNAEHKLRNMLLEILNRRAALPCLPRPHACGGLSSIATRPRACPSAAFMHACMHACMLFSSPCRI
jgi:hypothetical protein